MKAIQDMQNSLRQEQGSELARAIVTREVEGAKLTARVSPCSWMYPGYPFQISIELDGGGNCILADKNLKFENASISDMDRMLAMIGIVKCPKCGKPAFDPETVDTNRKGVCESCFLIDLNKEFDELTMKEEAELKRLDAKRKKEGFTHRVEAWIHPARGGDDKKLSIWMKNPTDAQIKSELKKAGSKMLDDYQIITL